MVVIGITGSFGTGKSTVAEFFKQLGAVVLDADALSREAVKPKKSAWRRIVKSFGRRVLNADATINRRKLADIVFKSSALRRKLEGIIHPQVMRAIKRSVREYRKKRSSPALVLDVPLLFEADAADWIDVLVVVTAPRRMQLSRLKKKYGLTRKDLDLRISAQMDLSAKAALADAVVDNGGSVESTRKQVERIWNQRVLRAAKRS